MKASFRSRPVVATTLLFAILLGWQAWTTWEGRQKLHLGALPPGTERVDIAVRLDFVPEAFHITRLQAIGRLIRVDGETAYLKDVPLLSGAPLRPQLLGCRYRALEGRLRWRCPVSAPARAMPRRLALGLPRSSFARGALGILLFLLAWQMSVPIIGLSSYFYPSPLDVWHAFLDLARKGILSDDIAASAGRYLAGVAAGTVVGVLLGVAIGLDRTVSRLLGPIVSFFFAIVEVAWIPLFVIWWGTASRRS